MESQQNATVSDNLLPEQIKLLELLMSGSSVSQAAKVVGIDRATFYRWRSSSPDFVKAHQDLLDVVWANTKGELKSLTGLAVQVLTDVMTKEDVSPRDKLAAAQIVLNNLHKIMEEDELRKRIQALAERMESSSV